MPTKLSPDQLANDNERLVHALSVVEDEKRKLIAQVMDLRRDKEDLDRALFKAGDDVQTLRKKLRDVETERDSKDVLAKRLQYSAEARKRNEKNVPDEVVRLRASNEALKKRRDELEGKIEHLKQCVALLQADLDQAARETNELREKIRKLEGGDVAPETPPVATPVGPSLARAASIVALVGASLPKGAAKVFAGHGPPVAPPVAARTPVQRGDR
jgi:predicted  nucleic acid-binding Zn-ribbon protein